jgi:hypothetical protein
VQTHEDGQVAGGVPGGGEQPHRAVTEEVGGPAEGGERVDRIVGEVHRPPVERIVDVARVIAPVAARGGRPLAPVDQEARLREQRRARGLLGVQVRHHDVGDRLRGDPATAQLLVERRLALHPDAEPARHAPAEVLRRLVGDARVQPAVDEQGPGGGMLEQVGGDRPPRALAASEAPAHAALARAQRVQADRGAGPAAGDRELRWAGVRVHAPPDGSGRPAGVPGCNGLPTHSPRVRAMGPGLLRPGLLDGRCVVVAGPATPGPLGAAVAAAAAALGARAEPLAVDPLGEEPSARGDADQLVWDGAGAFAATGRPSVDAVRAALDGAWLALRCAAAAGWIPAGRPGRAVLLAPAPGDAHAAAARAGLENLARTLRSNGRATASGSSPSIPVQRRSPDGGRALRVPGVARRRLSLRERHRPRHRLAPHRRAQLGGRRADPPDVNPTARSGAARFAAGPVVPFGFALVAGVLAIVGTRSVAALDDTTDQLLITSMVAGPLVAGAGLAVARAPRRARGGGLAVHGRVHALGGRGERQSTARPGSTRRRPCRRSSASRGWRPYLLALAAFSLLVRVRLGSVQRTTWLDGLLGAVVVQTLLTFACSRPRRSSSTAPRR